MESGFFVFAETLAYMGGVVSGMILGAVLTLAWLARITK
jgi:hypothetical protein